MDSLNLTAAGVSNRSIAEVEEEVDEAMPSTSNSVSRTVLREIPEPQTRSE